MRLSRALLLAVALFATTAPALHAATRTQTVYYRAGLMERIAQKRGVQGKSPDACYISTPLSDAIGSRWVVSRGAVALSCVQADVSHPRDRARHLKLNRLVELDQRSYLRLCGKLLAPWECMSTIRRE